MIKHEPSAVAGRRDTHLLPVAPGARRLAPLAALVCFLMAEPLASTDASVPFIAAPSSVNVAVYEQAQYHLESEPVRRVQATLSDSFHLCGITAKQWMIYAPDAPDTDDQEDTTSVMSVIGQPSVVHQWTELSPMRRPLIQTLVLGDNSVPGSQLATQVVYTATLCSRELVPGPPAGPVEELSRADRKLYTRDSDTIDYKSPAFQAWLDTSNLRRGRGERDLDFALRAFQCIRQNYTYAYDIAQDRRVSAVCQVGETDCGGLSQLFVATMRAGGVPATVLCGRMAKSSDDPSDHGGCHVKAQFYASGIGWVPVEMSGATCDRSAPYWVYFGRTYGDFLTLSVDNDQELDSGRDGIEEQRGMQGIRFWVWGDQDSGVQMLSSTNWSVQALPMPAGNGLVAQAQPQAQPGL
jgi:hypothetical protein